MAKDTDTKIKSEVNKVILTLCSHIRLKTEDSNAFIVGELAELTTALAALIEARVKIDEGAGTADIKSKFIEMLKTEMENNDY